MNTIDTPIRTQPHTHATITARFSSLRRAVNEARKYGVTASQDTIGNSIRSKGMFLHYLSHTRILSLSRVKGGKAWKMAVDVQGRVVPA